MLLFLYFKESQQYGTFQKFGKFYVIVLEHM